MKLENIFFQVGFKTAKHPCLVCTASLLITLSLMLGFLFLEMEVSPLPLINPSLDPTSKTMGKPRFPDKPPAIIFRKAIRRLFPYKPVNHA